MRSFSQPKIPRDQIDNATAQLHVGNPHECFGQGQSFRSAHLIGTIQTVVQQGRFDARIHGGG
jgi:hypothetical protein